MSPKKVDKRQRRTDIALVALEVFAEKGFDFASISQIAEAAGIGKGTVYEYFESKEDLIHHALVSWINGLSRTAEQTLSGIEDPIERLRVFVQSLIQVFLSDERTMKIFIAMFQMYSSSKERLLFQKLTQEMLQDFRQILVGLLLDGVARKAFRPETAGEVEKIAINLAAYLDGIALHFYLSGGDFDLQSQVGAYLEQLIENLSLHASE